jgi:hypothetical protein
METSKLQADLQETRLMRAVEKSKRYCNLLGLLIIVSRMQLL